MKVEYLTVGLLLFVMGCSNKPKNTSSSGAPCYSYEIYSGISHNVFHANELIWSVNGNGIKFTDIDTNANMIISNYEITDHTNNRVCK